MSDRGDCEHGHKHGWCVPCLRQAIKTHRSQRADDRCIEDDDRLYEALGDGIKCDRHVGSKGEMLTNCARFIDRRCEGGHWPSYAELEAALRGVCRSFEFYAMVNHPSQQPDEYDLMMLPLWREAARVLGLKPGEQP